MVESVNPADPERRRLDDDRRSGRQRFVRRNRWLSTEVPSRPGRPRGRHRSFRSSSWWRWGRSFVSTGSERSHSGWTRPRASDSRGTPSPNSGAGARSSIPGTRPSTTRSCTAGWASGTARARLRLPSAVFGVLTIPLVYALGRTIRDHRLGIVAALLFAISPFQVWYSQEARGYSLLTLGATSAMLGVAFLLRHPERVGNACA